MIVYKYLSPARTSVLRDARIRFTQAAALNDPFESDPIGTTLFKSLVESQREIYERESSVLSGMEKIEVAAAMLKNAREATTNFIEDIRQNFGILSVSKERSDLLMWSHYCDSHKGLVVGFEGLHTYF
jgi:hypothetical protein